MIMDDMNMEPEVTDNGGQTEEEVQAPAADDAVAEEENGAAGEGETM
jgi:hypothetical protein